MKKNFLNMRALGNRRFAPEFLSQRNGPHRSSIFHDGADYRSGAADDDEEDDEDDEDEKPKTDREKLLDKIQKRMSRSLKGYATKDELAAIKASQPEALRDISVEDLKGLLEKENGAMAVLARQGIDIQRMKTQLDKAPEDMSLRSQIKRWLSSDNALDGQDASGKKVSDVIKEIRAGKKSDLKPLDVELNHRVNSPMTPSNTYNGSAYLPKPELVPGLVDMISPTYTFWSYIKKGTSSSATLYWVNKKNPLGEAAFIAPGVYKPGVSFEIDTEISNAKKIAVNEKVAIELLDDIEGLATWIEDELMYQLYFKASTVLMTATATNTVPAGIQTLSVPFAFAALGLETTNPNRWDVIRSSVAQLRAGNFVGYSVTTFVNPIDMANMVMTKAQSQGQTFVPPATGSTIVEDNNIPKGYLQVALLDLYKVSIYKGFTMTWGLENDDFTKNLRTVIAEMRIHQYFSENHIGAFLFDTFENGIAQLESV